MNPAVTQIVVDTTFAAISASPGLAQWTPGMLDDCMQLPLERRKDLLRHAATLRRQLRVPNPEAINQRLIEVACFAPSWSSPLRKGRRSPSAALDILDSGVRTETKLRDVTHWIEWALERLLIMRHLPEPVRRELPIAEGDNLEVILAISQFVNANSPVPRSIDRAIRSLGQENVFELVEATVAMLEASEAMFRIAEPILAAVASLFSGALNDFQGRLADLPAGWFILGGAIFYKAPPAVSAKLLEIGHQLGFSENAEGLQRSLAWIGDAAVQHQFQAWRAEGVKLGKSFVEPYRYALEAGWELTMDGQRRELTFPIAFPVELASDEAPRSSDVLKIGGKLDESCGSCGNPLSRLIELDVSDQRLVSFSMSGRIQIPVCLPCYGVTFAEQVPKQGLRWSAASTGQPKAESLWLRRTSVNLGVRTSTPIEGLYTGGSWIGGYGSWHNDAVYPNCPRCSLTMRFLARIDLNAFGVVGLCHAFVCTDCRTSAAMCESD
jgi:hypothetical protein